MFEIKLYSCKARDVAKVEITRAIFLQSRRCSNQLNFCRTEDVAVVRKPEGCGKLQEH
jgi:hypothetical protein